MDKADGHAQCLAIIENVSEADPYYTCSKDFTVSNRLNIHQHTEDKKGLFVAFLNINGLRRNRDQFSSFLGEKGIHLLALKEKKVDNSYSKHQHLGYQKER